MLYPTRFRRFVNMNLEDGDVYHDEACLLDLIEEVYESMEDFEDELRHTSSIDEQDLHRHLRKQHAHLVEQLLLQRTLTLEDVLRSLARIAGKARILEAMQQIGDCSGLV